MEPRAKTQVIFHANIQAEIFLLNRSSVPVVGARLLRLQVPRPVLHAGARSGQVCLLKIAVCTVITRNMAYKRHLTRYS